MKLKNGKKKLKEIKIFSDSTYTSNISIDEAEMDQTNLLENMVKFNNKSRPRSKECKDKNEILLIV